MREIKFRFWYKKENRWLDNVRIDNHGDVYPLDDNGEEITSIDCTLIDKMQYTGLKDKNGKQIYEGDIVVYCEKKRLCPVCSKKEITSHIRFGSERFCPNCGTKSEDSDFTTKAQVVFKDGAFAYYMVPEEGFYQSWQADVAAPYLEWIEVVGNIYETTELTVSI